MFRKRFRVPDFGTGSETLEPAPYRFLRQVTTIIAPLFTVRLRMHMHGIIGISAAFLSVNQFVRP